jgi:hypothetical protein
MRSPARHDDIGATSCGLIVKAVPASILAIGLGEEWIED